MEPSLPTLRIPCSALQHRRLFAATVGLLAAVLLAFPTRAGAAPKLELLDKEAVAVKAGKGEDSKTVYVSVLNFGHEPVKVTADVEASSASEVKATLSSATIKAGRASRLPVTFSGLSSLKSDAEAQLVLRGGSAPVAAPVSIAANPKPKHDWPNRIVTYAVIAFFTLFGIVLTWSLFGHLKDLFSPAPGPKWSFSDSWASTLTTAGAVLGTVLASITLPDSPRPVDKDTIIELNLFFGALVVAAPFIFQTIRKPNTEVALEDPGLWGFNFVLLISCALTFAAVVGELATLGLLAWESADGADWRYVAVWSLASAALLAFYYSLVTTHGLVTADWKALDDADKAAARTAVADNAAAIGAAVAKAIQKHSEVLESMAEVEMKGLEPEAKAEARAGAEAALAEAVRTAAAEVPVTVTAPRRQRWSVL
jgi:hypothetical protein